MIGMSFGSFLSLLILGIIASIVLHLIVRYKMLSGFDGFMNKWIAGWIGVGLVRRCWGTGDQAWRRSSLSLRCSAPLSALSP
jgi:hypothetical protein